MEAYITAVEEAASKFPSTEADELSQTPAAFLDATITKTTTTASLTQHNAEHSHNCKQDTSSVVLTADKGVAMVIMDQQDYINKVNTVLQDTNTHRVLSKGCHHKPKNKLISTLRNIKQTGALSNKFTSTSTNNYIPPVQSLPNSMASPKFINLAPPQAHCVQ